ncbi:hypothetical protein ACPOL_7008 (plasmid) [Acidisarcina polymorpha]|uniref:Uncharacterized protein n=1 Tax=Acidisarcina polymorpha TaxID=2211140 RepID=A0A2Z5GBA8_9BACT|nr:hypothetical protein ACPOL_7008 [Acidisarcina polymorpha]
MNPQREATPVQLEPIHLPDFTAHFSPIFRKTSGRVQE